MGVRGGAVFAFVALYFLDLDRAGHVRDESFSALCEAAFVFLDRLVGV